MPRQTITIEELRRQLRKQQTLLDRLQARRNSLTRRLAKVDQQIADIAGGVAPARKAAPAKAAKAKRRGKAVRARRWRRSKDRPVTDYIKDVLGKAPQGMRARDIAKAVLAAGYPTRSGDFYGIVAATLRDAKNFKRISRGVYKLAK